MQRRKDRKREIEREKEREGERETDRERETERERERENVVLCTHYLPYKTNDPDLWNCKAGNGCIALHYSVHFLRIFSFVSFSYEGEGIGARSVRPPPRFDVCPTRTRKHGHRTRGNIVLHHWSYSFNHTATHKTRLTEPVEKDARICCY